MEWQRRRGLRLEFKEVNRWLSQLFSYEVIGFFLVLPFGLGCLKEKQKLSYLCQVEEEKWGQREILTNLTFSKQLQPQSNPIFSSKTNMFQFFAHFTNLSILYFPNLEKICPLFCHCIYIYLCLWEYVCPCSYLLHVSLPLNCMRRT